MIRRLRTGDWLGELLLCLVALSVAFAIFLHYRARELRNNAPDTVTAATDLSIWTLAGANLPSGWQVVLSGPDRGLVLKDEVLAAWQIQAITPNAGISAVEQVAVLRSAHAAQGWIDNARGRGAVVDKECQYHAGDAAVTLYQAAGDNGFVHRIDIRRRYAIARMYLYSRSSREPWAGCSAELDGIVQQIGRQLDGLVRDLPNAGRLPTTAHVNAAIGEIDPPGR